MNLGSVIGASCPVCHLSLLSDKFVSRDNFLNILKSVSTNMMLSSALIRNNSGTD